MRASCSIIRQTPPPPPPLPITLPLLHLYFPSRLYLPLNLLHSRKRRRRFMGTGNPWQDKVTDRLTGREESCRFRLMVTRSMIPPSLHSVISLSISRDSPCNPIPSINASSNFETRCYEELLIILWNSFRRKDAIFEVRGFFYIFLQKFLNYDAFQFLSPLFSLSLLN